MAEQRLQDSDWREALLACLENAVRLARAAGATEIQIQEAVQWAVQTPEAADVE